MPSTYNCKSWTIQVVITTPTANTYLANCITSGAYLIETLLTLSSTPIGSSTESGGTTIINYPITETEPDVPTLTALDSLFGLFGYTVL